MRNRVRLFQPLRRFRKETEGSVTIEFVLWVPVFMGLILLAADTSIAFMRQTDLWNLSRDTARIVARHGMDEAEASEFIRAQLGKVKVEPEIHVVISEDTVQVQIAAAARDMAPFGILGFTGASRFVASVTQVMEPI